MSRDRQATAAPILRFSQEELDRAYEEWNCNCGPAALAAVLGWTLGRVRPVLGDFESRGYMSPTMMGAAIERAGFRRRDAGAWPLHGLVRIQFGGPWLEPGVPPRAASCYTHWVGSKRVGPELWAYDVNADWLPLADWERDVVPRLVASYRRADGTWSPSHRWEVRQHRAATGGDR